MRPMLASPGAMPDPSDHSWAYEVKWDGMRAMGRVSRGQLHLTSRSGTATGGRFSEVAAADHGLPEGSVIDGEIVAFDPEGRPSFSLLAPRLQRAAPGRATIGRIVYVVFDLLQLGDSDVMAEPYRDRRRLLREALAAGPRLAVPEDFADGAALLATTAAAQLEGVVAKRVASPYRPGVRSDDWLKIPHRRTRSLVIGGWKTREHSPSRLASVLVGTPTDDGMLRYEGAVGSGLSSAETHALEVVLADIETPESPFHGYPAPTAAAGDVLRWTGPVLVVDVEHLGRTANGLLRQPSAARLRPDLDYGDLVEGRGA